MSNKSEVNTFEGCLGLFVFVVIATIIGSIVGGYVLSIMWGWFVVPLFNLPPLSVPYAIGIILVVSFLRQPNYKSSPDKEKAISKVCRNSGGDVFSSYVFRYWVGSIAIYRKVKNDHHIFIESWSN